MTAAGTHRVGVVAELPALLLELGVDPKSVLAAAGVPGDLLRDTENRIPFPLLGRLLGAFQTFERGRTSDVSCACHWTVNVAASAGHGRLYRDAYSVAPGGVFVAAESPIRRPEDLAGVPISVGFQSGSHYATLQALEQFLPRASIDLSFADGLLFKRMENLIDGAVPAVSVFSGPYYFLEQLGFRKILDCTFMIAAMLTGEPDPAQVSRYFAALRRAQADIDLRPDRYTHYYRKEFPARFQDQMDPRRWGPGERLVFEPYTRAMFEDSQAWIAERGIFEAGAMGHGDYERAVAAAA